MFESDFAQKNNLFVFFADYIASIWTNCCIVTFFAVVIFKKEHFHLSLFYEVLILLFTWSNLRFYT